jgi:hypothetical protein
MNKHIPAILKNFFKTFSYILIMCVVLPKSWWVGFKSLFKPDQLLVEKKYQGEKILLIALYQKGELRPDIKRLLVLAKRLGYFIIGVNSLKLDEDVTDLFDCYIERFNFGRDFGSYKTGFEYIFSKKYHHACPRLLILNDSVYYELTRSEKFLTTLMNTPIEVLSATENFESGHHLGSFCISINGRILSHKKFIQFWKDYKRNDVRPIVIQKGEVKLSFLLRRLARTSGDFCALYNLTFVANLLKSDEQLINTALKMARQGRNVTWPRLNPKNTLIHMAFENYFKIHEITGGVRRKSLRIEPAEPGCLMLDVKDIVSFFKDHIKIDSAALYAYINHAFCASILKNFRCASQIHQSNAFLLHIGLPLIKLDGFYRGFFSEDDVLTISNQLSADQALELEQLLFHRSFAGDVLQGWGFLLFKQGFL